MKENLIQILKNSLRFGALPPVFYRDSDEKAFLDSIFSTGLKDNPVQENPPAELKTETENAVSEVSPGDDQKTLKEYIRDCRICGNLENRKYPSGSLNNGLMIILNAPMMMSSLEKNLYKNDSIEMLKNIIEKGIGIELKNIYITNIIKCEPDSLINKPSTMFKNCEKIIRREIREINPRVILVMGDMLPLRPILRTSGNIQWYNIDHPVTILKHPSLKRKAWNTIVEMKKYMDDLT
ncbi:MAG: hypothetical protein JW982_07375 [Spirochaetes bacterium]|nr:hypothetical protein [Spirochaetota bacterium]